MLVIAKRIGLSFMELNELRVMDLFDLVESYTGKKDTGPREATQEDIDAFFA